MTGPATFAKYKRLPGRARNMASSGTLWQGDDHLLMAETTGYVETYKRFYYRDIQAFIIRMTWSRAIGNGILLMAAAIPGFPAIWHPEIAPIMGGISTFFLFLALINTLRGTGCRVHLVTAVNVQPLGMLQRLSAATKLFRRIQPAIEAAQGPLGDVGVQLDIEPAPAAPAAGSVQPAA
ncbi:MAG TPA: hypothetical protein VIH35_02660, partial [Kiritimatiellia bacterium]